ncbi:MAG: thiamine phosphate synthase [Actinobacteria bacterium]|nr:thiamine phosphate synthase [Actinomycetota bacterium]MBL7124044.1 thiamine phosphate synthase [Actinomycetota bacterium]
MKEKLEDMDLYFITDSNLTKKTILEDVKSAIRAGVKIIQYREKGGSTGDMIKEAKATGELCKKNNVLFIINDRVDIVLAVDADGVHLGNKDMTYSIARKILGSKKIIGLTVHNIREAVEAERIGADYVGVSPIFETKTKLDAGRPAGLKLIKDIKKAIKIPFVAIGGINENNLGSVIEAGARSIVAISAIVTKDNVEKECKKFREVIINDSIK